MSHENEIDFAQYLKQGEGSLFERDPEKAMEQEKMCGIVREYEPYDCMWPVRDEDHVPKSKEVFYSQTTKDEKIHVIKREIFFPSTAYVSRELPRFRSIRIMDLVRNSGRNRSQSY